MLLGKRWLLLVVMAAVGSLLFNLRKVVLAATEVISLASHLKSLAVACEFIFYV